MQIISANDQQEMYSVWEGLCFDPFLVGHESVLYPPGLASLTSGIQIPAGPAQDKAPHDLHAY